MSISPGKDTVVPKLVFNAGHGIISDEQGAASGLLVAAGPDRSSSAEQGAASGLSGAVGPDSGRGESLSPRRLSSSESVALDNSGAANKELDDVMKKVKIAFEKTAIDADLNTTMKLEKLEKEIMAILNRASGLSGAVGPDSGRGESRSPTSSSGSVALDNSGAANTNSDSREEAENENKRLKELREELMKPFPDKEKVINLFFQDKIKNANAELKEELEKLKQGTIATRINDETFIDFRELVNQTQELMRKSAAL